MNRSEEACPDSCELLVAEIPVSVESLETFKFPRRAVIEFVGVCCGALLSRRLVRSLGLEVEENQIAEKLGHRFDRRCRSRT